MNYTINSNCGAVNLVSSYIVLAKLVGRDVARGSSCFFLWWSFEHLVAYHSVYVPMMRVKCAFVLLRYVLCGVGCWCPASKTRRCWFLVLWSFDFSFRECVDFARGSTSGGRCVLVVETKLWGFIYFCVCVGGETQLLICIGLRTFVRLLSFPSIVYLNCFPL